MKKQVLSVIATTFALTAFAQLPVSTAPENKKAVLEEFTGIHCGYCPDGHQIASQIYANDPSNTLLINIHAGSFATSSNGEQDFITYSGGQINGTFNTSQSYPNGTMNRTVLTGSVVDGDRSLWAGWASTIKTQTAYCNVALEGSMDTVSAFDPNTGVHLNILTVKAEVYFTANSPQTHNFLSIVLLEDSIHGIQTNYGNYNAGNYNADGTYNHNHVFRAMLSAGNFGQQISTTTAGTTYTTKVTYTLPLTYGAAGRETTPNIHQMHLVGFVSETSGTNNKKIINGNHGPITFPEAVPTGIKNNGNMGSLVSLYPNPTSGVAKVRVTTDKASAVSVSVYNQVGQMVYEAASKDLAVGTNDIEINTQSWAAGLYNVVVKGSAGTVAKKLNVVK